MAPTCTRATRPSRAAGPGIGAGRYYGYVHDLLGQVHATFRRHGLDPERSAIHFVDGMMQETLHPTGPVAVAHIDCDRYHSVRVCLERIAPRLSPRGVMIIDDYESKSGCRRAVDEFLARCAGRYVTTLRSRLHIRRRG